MSFSNAVVSQINKAIQRAAAGGDTRAVNKLTKMADKPDAVTNRLQQIEAKQAEFGDTPVDTYIHRTGSQGDINEGNFRYRSGTTPAAAGKGEGIFTTPTGYADDTAAYGSREFGVVTERVDAPKLGQGRHELAAGSKEIPETFIPENQVQEIFEIKPLQVERDPNMNLRGLPKDIEGVDSPIGAFKPALESAGRYMQKTGLEYKPPVEYKKIDPRFSRKVAQAYDEMKHDPHNPEVKEAYGAMIRETGDQYDEMIKSGLKVEFIPEGMKDPYPNPRMMTDDVVKNNHMWVFPTKQGFGHETKFKDNPLLADSGRMFGNDKATSNDVFRAVHDYYGHVKEGVGFRGDGEENAFLSHSSMFSPKAQRALATETRGQNSWLNWGPEGRTNRTAKTGETVFADQKIGLLPRKFTDVAKSQHLPQTEVLTDTGMSVVEQLGKFTENFKGAIGDMRKSSAIKKLLGDKDLSDRNVAGFGMDVLKIIDENSAGSFRKINGQKVYERVSQQDMLDKLGRRIEARLRKPGEERMSPQERRQVGAVMLEFGRGNMGKFIQEDMLTTPIGKKLFLTTSPEFKDWAKAGGRSLMRAFDDVTEARNPSTSKPHGTWKLGEQGEVLEYPEGSSKVDFFAGGTKADVSESAFPHIADSLNILGGHKTGMDKSFYSAWKNLGKKGMFKETAGPAVKFKERLDMEKLTPEEFDELNEAFDVVNIRGQLENPDGMTPSQFMKIKEETFTSRIKALEAIARETKTARNQRTAKQSATRRISEELDKRFENADDAGAYFQHNVDTRGRVYPVDPSGASISSGGAIRHGFTGAKKPISYGDEGFNQIVDDLVLFDGTANLSKIQGSGLERHKHWVQNQEKYLRQGQEALDNAENPDWNPKWLKGQKDQGPYLRAVMEISRIKNAAKNDAPDMIDYMRLMEKERLIENPEGLDKMHIQDSLGKLERGEMDNMLQAKHTPYESNMMIEVDAPSSGSQHIGAQYGDESILWQTSVLTEPVGKGKVLTSAEIRSLTAGVPDDSVARDLYTDVGVLYSKNVEKGFADLATQDPQKAEAFKFFSDKYLSSGRGVVKPIVMKVPYGAGDDSLYRDLVSQLTGRQRLEMADAGIDAEELMGFHWKNMQGALKEGLKTQYEFKQFNKVLGNIYKKAQNRKPLKVEGPDGGMTDLTRYVMKPKKTFRAEVKPERVPDFGTENARELAVYTAEPKIKKGAEGVRGMEVDIQSTVQGLSPNITHSLDSAYLHRLVKAANDQGIELRVVHDAFFAHPNDIKAVKQIAGQVFKDMHSGYNLRQKMIEGVARATGESVENITDMVKASGLSLERGFDLGAQPDAMFTNVIRGG